VRAIKHQGITRQMGGERVDRTQGRKAEKGRSSSLGKKKVSLPGKKGGEKGFISGTGDRGKAGFWDRSDINEREKRRHSKGSKKDPDPKSNALSPIKTSNRKKARRHKLMEPVGLPRHNVTTGNKRRKEIL